LGLQFEGGAGAIDRILAPIAVVEGFAKAAVERGSLIGRYVASAEPVAAGVEIAGAQCIAHGSAGRIRR